MPCPFCGSTVWIATGGCGYCSHNSLNAVKCKNCGNIIDQDPTPFMGFCFDQDPKTISWRCDKCGTVHNKYGKVIGGVK